LGELQKAKQFRGPVLCVLCEIWFYTLWIQLRRYWRSHDCIPTLLRAERNFRERM